MEVGSYNEEILKDSLFTLLLRKSYKLFYSYDFNLLVCYNELLLRLSILFYIFSFLISSIWFILHNFWLDFED